MTTSAPHRPTLGLHGPDELLHAIPYLLGFHATDSLVLVGVCDGAVVVTARMDLHAVPIQLASTVAAMQRSGADQLIAVVYATWREPRAALPCRDLIDAAEWACRDIGMALIEALLVDEGRWWSYLCAERDCCPPEGRPLSCGESRVAAEATYAGLVALPDREALENALQPDPDVDGMRHAIVAAEQAAVHAALDARVAKWRRSAVRQLFAMARRFDTAGTAPEIDDDTIARLAVALREIPVRDAVWVAVDDGRLDGRALWRLLARRVPPPHDAAALFLYAWASWRDGDGASANIAAERAIRSDPGYRAADLLLGALVGGLDPRRVPRIGRRRPKRRS